MKVRSFFYGMLCMLALGASMASCSDDNDDDPHNDAGSTVTLPQVRAYFLNEGTMGYNNSTIAFYAPNGDADFIGDIFKEQNGHGLGDTGQDMIEYDDYIYVAVYGSNYLAKLNSACVELKRLSFVDDKDLQAGVRYLVADDGYIYASFWGGVVAKINAQTLTIESKLIDLGGNLEGMVICEDMLYVANSCTVGATTVYNDEIKVIDLNTFTLKETLTVVSNPYNQMLEAEGKVFFISNDYDSVDGYVLQMIDPLHNNKVTTLGNATYIAVDGDVLYAINSITDWDTYLAVNTFFTYNIKTGQINNASFLKNVPANLEKDLIYMLEINEYNGDIYIGTSDFSTNGTIYRFKKDGTFVEDFDAGGISPNCAVFFN
ncbi:DUF5074 domain-containing protein [uncultured Bacteroides sp.]|uniref:YncE family protein n=1 Tax=uncultured Bacteroides sp. TaxID=162156 RepID=UPI0026102AF6|nr:DUF5074 domain-containing protein [uncultured Bacteroides sp.]